MSASAAEGNVNRTISFAGTCTAIFTFSLVFLFPRISSGEVDSSFFQSALVASGISIFSFTYSGLNYYIQSLALSHEIEDHGKYRRRADIGWQIGFCLFLLQPSLILFSVRLDAVAIFFSTLWLIHFVMIVKVFRETQSWIRSSK